VSFYGGACQKRPGAAKTSVGVADRSIFDIRTYIRPQPSTSDGSA
jgi:hypothetical protein